MAGFIRGLSLIYTLCLICVTCSETDKLTLLKGRLLSLEKELHEVKTNYTVTRDIVSELTEARFEYISRQEEALRGAPPELNSLVDIVQREKADAEKSKVTLDNIHVDVVIELWYAEHKLAVLRELIEYLEEGDDDDFSDF